MGRDFDSEVSLAFAVANEGKGMGYSKPPSAGDSSMRGPVPRFFECGMAMGEEDEALLFVELVI